MNKIIIIGNLGQDPEMRYSTSGNPMTGFSIASNRSYTTAAGERREETEWFNCTAFGRLADTCNQYLTRGQQVYVEGRLRSREYTRRDGASGFSLDVTVTEVHFLGRREDQQGDGGGYGGQRGGYNRPADSDGYSSAGGGAGRPGGDYGGGRPDGGGGAGRPGGDYGGGNRPGDDMVDVDDLPF